MELSELDTKILYMPEKLSEIEACLRTTILDAPLCKRRRGNTGKSAESRQRRFLSLTSAFDIETTTITFPSLERRPYYHAIMYIWQWQIGEKITIIGRLWSDFLKVKKIILECLKARGPKICMAIYVHNLSFEFQFLSGIYPFNPEDVFAVKSRKILKCVMNGVIEFRCSYLLTNNSLVKFLSKMREAFPSAGIIDKLSGEEFNYSKTRYPWTPLTEQELLYSVVDVYSLVRALNAKMIADGDTLETIPRTSTGYLRRDVKRALHPKSQYLKTLFPEIELYTALEESFMGGFVHANYHYVGIILHNVYSDDRSSSYPACQCLSEFPLTPFRHDGPLTAAGYNEIRKQHRAIVMRCTFEGIKPLDEHMGISYIPKSKCRNLVGGTIDNGRIINADHLEITLTDIDLCIIKDLYTWDALYITDSFSSRYGALPSEWLDIIKTCYRDKTALKGVDGQEYFYNRQKEKTNSNYGLSAQKPAKPTIEYRSEKEDVFCEKEESTESLLASAKPTVPYQWGVWTTAHARYELWQSLKLSGNKTVYWDTDSDKHLEPLDLTAYNSALAAKSESHGCSATDKHGNRHHMGVYENDGVYDEFITWGAKKYAYIARDKDGDPYLSITIAGVNKKKGAEELVQAAKEDIKATGQDPSTLPKADVLHYALTLLKPGFIFREAGGQELIYNDHCNGEIGLYSPDGQYIPITNNVAFIQSTYELGITSEFEKLIEYAE